MGMGVISPDLKSPNQSIWTMLLPQSSPFSPLTLVLAELHPPRIPEAHWHEHVIWPGDELISLKRLRQGQTNMMKHPKVAAQLQGAEVCLALLGVLSWSSIWSTATLPLFNQRV